MGGILDTPHTEKATECGDGNNLKYAVCSMQGWRVEMEDAHCAQISLPNLDNWSFFAVFDGHAGGFVSAHSAEHLLTSILATDEFSKIALEAEQTNDQLSPPNTSNTANEESSQDNNSTPVKGDEAKQSTANDALKAKIRYGFLKLDEDIRLIPMVASGKDISGSTCVSAFISPTHYYFANCGDSRAVLSRKGTACAFTTLDHKPSNPEEKDRIQKAGGSVMIHRVNGSLAVSRAIGDFQYKQVPDKGATEQLVSPEPEVTVFSRDPDDEFIVLACDGVWDVMKNDEVISYVRHQLKIESDLEEICSSLIDTCLHKGSTDNMSVILVTFPGAPKVDDEMCRLDTELNREIEKHVFDLLSSEGGNPSQASIYLLTHSLKNLDLPNLPPGGGLDAKRSRIEKAQKDYIRMNSGAPFEDSSPTI